MKGPPDDPYNVKLAQEKAEWDAKQKAREKAQYVTLTNINIPFTKLVGFLVKLAIAAVPAAIIVAIFWSILATLFFRVM